MNSERGYAAAVKKAQQDYLVYLKTAAHIFDSSLFALKGNCLGAEGHEAARVMAHKLAGNAMMYGFSALGDLARDIEGSLKTFPAENPDTLAPKITQIIDKITEICSPMNKSESNLRNGNTVQKVYGLPKSPTRPNLLNRLSVLLAYSDPWMSGLIASMLEPEFKVIQSPALEDSFALAGANTPDIIVIENDTETGSGISLIEDVRSDDTLSSVPIITVVQRDHPETMVAAISAGATECFENPHDILPIVERIRALLQRKPRHVLIVDDDIAVRELLGHRFEASGITISTANDGIEALEYLKTSRPDLIILDRMMPRLEGGAVLYEIQNEINLKSIPVMIVSAMSNRKEAVGWLKRGAVDYMSKPFDPDEIVLRGLRHLGVKKAV